MKPLIKFILPFVSSILLLPCKVVEACGFWVYPGEYRFWLLQPDIVNEPDLTPFYFAATHLYKNDLYAGKEFYVDQNINEWFEAVERTASKKDIGKLLNETSPEVFFKEQKRLASQNTLMARLLQPKQKELYEYMSLSKKVEEIATNPDPWDEKAPQLPVSGVINELKQLQASAKTSFVKLRTAFQLVRLYNYNSQPKEAEKIYDTWIAPVNTESWIKTAGLYQVALNYGGARGNYLRSKVFDLGGYNRTMCLVWFSSKDTDETLRLAKSQHEKNVILAMKIFNYPGRSLEMIKQIYSSEPNYKELPFLLLREINKVEDWLLTNKVTSFLTPAVYNDVYWRNYDYADAAILNYQNDQAYSKELSGFLHSMITNSASRQKALLHLYAAHIDMLNQEYKSSSNHLAEASRQKDVPQNVKTQIAINRYLLHLEDGFDEKVESEFMKIIKTPDQKLGIYDPAIMKNQLILYTARKLINKDDKVKGLLLLSKTNRAIGELPISGYKSVYQEIEERANDKDYYALLGIFDKKNKTPFEHFVCEKSIHSPFENHEWYEEDSTTLKWDRNKIMDCLASWYLRKHRLKDAFSILKQIPDSFWGKWPYDFYIGGNPFYLNFYKAHPVTKEDKRSLNKKQVVEEMIHLEELAKKDKSKAAECYYQIANAWYNMTWYGKNWLMVKQWWTINEPDTWSYPVKKTTFNDDYYGCLQAKQYYDLAIKATTDKRLAALCFFMSNNCNANYKHYMELVNGKKDADYNYSPDYTMAQKKGIDQNLYKQVIEECETYQSFIRQYNKKY